jgi:hypothetical protein
VSDLVGDKMGDGAEKAAGRGMERVGDQGGSGSGESGGGMVVRVRIRGDGMRWISISML